jgi:hypothetical protein
MRQRRVAAATAAFIAGASLAVAPTAHATGGSAIYVGAQLTTSKCSDTAAGAGSLTTPFCTVQAAVSIVQPGDTIFTFGTLTPFSISTSGTAAAPITIRASGSVVESTDSTPAVTVSGASYVNLIGVTAWAGTGPAVLVTESDHITYDRGTVERLSSSSTSPQPALHVTGGSSYVTISRNEGEAFSTGGVIRVDGGGTGDEITTNLLDHSTGAPAVTVDGTSQTAVTSNTVTFACGAAIQVTGGSTATVENNVVSQMASAGRLANCLVKAADTRGLTVDAASAAAGTTADYNDVDVSFAGAGALPYSWAGTSYASPAAFTAAAGQGAHDATGPTVPNPAAMSGASAAAVDSADADAPGELPTDYQGNLRVDDPVVPDTGTGAHTFYDRGATETVPGQASRILNLASDHPATDASITAAPVGATVIFTGIVHDPWDATLSCLIDFGDGTTATVAATSSGAAQPTIGACATTHHYAAVGSYKPSLSVTYTTGDTGLYSTAVTIDAPAPVVPSLSLVASSGVGVTPVCNATSGWNIASYSISYGDGGVTGDCSGHAFQKPGTYAVTMTATDADGNSASTTQSFTTLGNRYTPLTPSRILDTRDGTGTGAVQKVPANGVLRLKVAGVDGTPDAGATAVVLNVTVVGPAAGGHLTAYPDGAAAPNTSNLNFAAGQTIPNTVVVKLGADGYVDLANASPGTTDLVADVEGYYSVDGSSGYYSIQPTRVLDTRVSKTTLAPGGTTRVYFGSYNSASAVALNVTVADAAKDGHITAYPDGAAEPDTSNVNFSAGQIAQNEAIVRTGADGYVDFANASTGSTDLIVDITGDFSVGTGLSFVPITPVRLLDTRQGGGPLAAYGTRIAPMSANSAIGPGTAVAVAANITVTGPTAGGYATVYPDDMARPGTSVLNFNRGQTIPNATTIGAGWATDDGIELYNGSAGTADLIVDVFGLYN